MRRVHLFALAAIAAVLFTADAGACGRGQARREARQEARAERRGCSGGQSQALAFPAPQAPAAPAAAVTSGGCANGRCGTIQFAR